MNDSWYRDGLHFKCTQCGGCCTGAPGYVWVTDREIETLSKHLKISKEEFTRRYTRQVGNRLSLTEDSKNFDCVFLKEKKSCSVYQARPKQCKTFPWWKENLKSKEAWQNASMRCEGIDHPDSPKVPCDDIKSFLK